MSVTLKIAPPANGTESALSFWPDWGSVALVQHKPLLFFLSFFPSLFSSGFVFCFPVVCQRQFQSERADEAEIDCDTQPDYVTGLTETESLQNTDTRP